MKLCDESINAELERFHQITREQLPTPLELGAIPLSYSMKLKALVTTTISVNGDINPVGASA